MAPGSDAAWPHDLTRPDAGTSLSHLAVALVIAHPAVTAAIIGPRTMGQLQDLLASAD